MAVILDGLSSFAQRVIHSIGRNSAALLWPVNGPVLVTRDRWLQLCRGVAALLRLINEHRAQSPAGLPDAERLADAAARARAVFGPFAAQRWRRVGLSAAVLAPLATQAIASGAAAAQPPPTGR